MTSDERGKGQASQCLVRSRSSGAKHDVTNRPFQNVTFWGKRWEEGILLKKQHRFFKTIS
jgi:hypothetical protein